MDKNIIERYKSEMMNMYRLGKTKSAIQNVTPVVSEITPQSKTPNNPQNKGELVAIVTTLRSLYPVENAKVTVFTGNTDNMQVLGVKFTDQSGKTDAFILETPERSESLNSQNKEIPYAVYNMMVEADGYLTNIHLNIPVFSGVISLQRSNMMLLETAGENKGPQIFDEGQKYEL